MKAIEIDVAIPNYNSIFLADTLESVLNQNEGNFELNIFVVDDCSNPILVSNIQKTYEARGVKFYHSLSNQGMVNNFNKCLEIANNKYVHVLHSDDLVHPDYYNTLSMALELDADIGLISCSSQSFSKGKLRPFTLIKLDEEQLFNQLKFRNVLAASSVIIKTDIGKELKFSEKFSHNNDWHLWLKITAKYKSYYVPETLHTYRIHANNDTKKYSDIFILSEDLRMLTSLQSEGILTKSDLQIGKQGIVQNAMYKFTNSLAKFELTNCLTIFVFIYKSLGFSYTFQLLYLASNRYVFRLKRLCLKIAKKTSNLFK